MDQSAKTLGQMIFLFAAIFLILGIVSFYFVSQSARNAAYTVVEYLEIRGYDQTASQVIEEYADSKNIDVTVTAVDSGIYSAGGKNRYMVEVSFDHVFAVIGFGRTTKYTVYTRAVDY